MDRLTVAETAKRMGRNPELVREWLREGRLRGEKFGRDWFVRESDLARFRKAEPGRRRRAAHKK